MKYFTPSLQWAPFRATIFGLLWSFLISLCAGEVAGQTLVTGQIGGPFCAGTLISVPYEYTGSPNPNVNNVFIAELSDRFGSFANPVTIGTLSSAVPAFTVPATIPNNVVEGTGYRIRVRSTNPVVTGAPNTSDITIYEVFTGSAIFSESLGTVVGNIVVSNHTNFQNSGLTFSGTGATRVSDTSPLSNGYTGASGQANIRMNGAGTFTISGINTENYSDMGFGFGIKKNNASSNASEIVVEASADGVNWNVLSFPIVEAGGGTNNVWYHRVALGDIPSAPNLRLRFTHPGSSNTYHFDDFKLGNAVEPTLVVLDPPSPVSVCTSQSTELSVTDVPEALFDWTNGSTENTTVVNSNGNYSVTVSDLFGCAVHRGPVNVTVGGTFSPSVSVTRAPEGTICEGTAVTFKATPLSGGPTPTYQWKKNGVNVGSGTATYVDSNLNHNDQVQVVMTSSLSCASPASASSNTLTIPVNPSVTPSVTASASPGLVVCPGMNITFTANPVNTGSSPVYQWKRNGTNVGTNSTSYTATAPGNGDIIQVVMTSNAACRTTDQVNSSPATIQLRQPMGMITGGTATICSTTPSHNINLFVVGTGAVSGTLNPGGVPFSGMAPQISVAVNPSTTTTYTIAALQDQNCNAQALMGSATVTVLQAVLYYADNDGDGYGDNNVTQWSCYGQPAGYITQGGDCDDDNPDVHPGADEWFNGIDDNCNGEIDEGVQTYTYYRDADGDGFGDAGQTIQGGLLAVIGYVGIAGDCDDTNPSVYPGALEICGNGIDDDCDGIIDEGCGPINDERESALVLFSRPYGECQYGYGTLEGATVSPEEGVDSETGEDVWYYFTAETTAARIACNTTSTNVLLEVQTQSGTVITSENANPNKGNEVLVWTNLTPGETYYVRVRNYNAAQGAGTFNMCINHFRRSRFQSGGSTLTLCQQIKCEFVQAHRYAIKLTPIGGGSTIVHQTAPAITTAVLADVQGILYNTSYHVTVDAIYNVHDGNGNPTTLEVPSNQTWTLHTGNHITPMLRPTDICPKVLSPGAQIGATAWVCGATAYQFEFTPVAPIPGGPILRSNNGVNRFIHLHTVGLMPGYTYNVRVRPLFGAIPGNWGNAYQCIQIAGTSSMVLGGEDADMGLELDEDDLIDALTIELYPNPVISGPVQILLTSPNDGQALLEVLDMNGRVCHSENVPTQAGTRSNVILDIPELHAGNYIVRVSQAGMRLSRKLMVLSK